MKITSNSVVSLKYKLSDNETGENIEETTNENPLVFLYGVGGMLPDFEQNLEGKTSGDLFDFNIPAAKAYGEHDAKHIALIPTSVFHDDKGKFDAKMFKIGALVPMSDSEGNQLRGRIIEVDKENVKMDFNHPLAGTDLHFSGEIIAVRAANEDEIAHGHVHGEHGHQH